MAKVKLDFELDKESLSGQVVCVPNAAISFRNRVPVDIRAENPGFKFEWCAPPPLATCSTATEPGPKRAVHANKPNFGLPTISAFGALGASGGSISSGIWPASGLLLCINDHVFVDSSLSTLLNLTLPRLFKLCFGFFLQIQLSIYELCATVRKEVRIPTKKSYVCWPNKCMRELQVPG